VEKMLEALKLDVAEKKSYNIDTLKAYLNEHGARKLTGQLKFDDAQVLGKDLGLDDKATKISVSKSFATKVKESGLEETVKSLSKEALEAILDVLEVDKEDSAKAMVAQVTDQLRSVGAALIFSKLSVSLLREICEDLGLEATSVSTNHLISAIMGEEIEEREKKAAPKISKDKPDIVKGVDIDSLVYHYTRDELKEFCDKNNITVNGKKRAFAKKAVDFLNGDLKPGPKKREEREKRETSKGKEREASEGEEREASKGDERKSGKGEEGKASKGDKGKSGEEAGKGQGERGERREGGKGRGG